MDDRKDLISSTDPFTKLSSDAAPTVVDVRHNADAGEIDRRDVPSLHSPDEIEESWTDLSDGRTVVTYCFHGTQVGDGVASALRLMGVEANIVEGGVAA
jgi:rhodanese-related sulfurtransferase